LIHFYKRLYSLKLILHLLVVRPSVESGVRSMRRSSS